VADAAACARAASALQTELDLSQRVAEARLADVASLEAALAEATAREAALQAAAGGGGGGAGGARLDGIDALYLKNVVLRFIEASAGGRDPSAAAAALPAVATLLQFSREEFGRASAATCDAAAARAAGAPPGAAVLADAGVGLASLSIAGYTLRL
jgi:hypothetical protein